jgi:uncharacterized membrane protein YoaK (UPF0700 family)
MRGRGHVMQAVAGGELLLVVGALLTSILAGTHPASPARDAIAALLALAMGLPNAAVRQLKVFDLTTTVLTMTLTGIAADLHQRDHFAVIRRLLAVIAMLAGAVTSTLLVLHVSDVAALGLAACLLTIVVGSAIASSRSPAPWHAPRS